MFKLVYSVPQAGRGLHIIVKQKYLFFKSDQFFQMWNMFLVWVGVGFFLPPEEMKLLKWCFPFYLLIFDPLH